MPSLPEARGPLPHGRAQDQQRPGPGPAREAHGQDPGGGGDGGGAARGGLGHGLREAGPRVRRLHGHRGHGPPGPQREAHAPAGRGGPGRRLRRAHPQGRDQRGHARLGHERAHHPLPPGLRAGRAPLSDDGPRLPRGHRRRGAHPGPLADGPPPRRAGGLRGGRLERHRPLHRVPGRRRGPHGRGGGGGPLREAGGPRGPLPGRAGTRGAARRPPGRAPGHAHLPLAGRGGQRAAHPLRLGGPRLPGHRSRARPPARPGPGRVRDRERRRGALAPSAPFPNARASCPPSSRRTPWPSCCGRSGSAARPAGGREPLGPRRQGPGPRARPRDREPNRESP